MSQPQAHETDADDQLIAAFRAGNDQAFSALYDRYNAVITTFAARMLGRREEGEEVCTEVFVSVVEGRYKTQGGFRSWIFTVTRRACIDRIRKRSRRSALIDQFGQGPGSASQGQPAPSPEDHIESVWTSERIRQAMRSLKDPHREAILLFYTGDLTTRQIADIMETTDSQVRSLLSYARKKLRQELS